MLKITEMTEKQQHQLELHDTFVEKMFALAEELSDAEENGNKLTEAEIEFLDALDEFLESIDENEEE